MDNKNKGFTLAEVLITLAIIGVVAALTIPTIINNNQKTQTVVGFKKVYSTLTNAIKISEVSNGEIDSWDFSYTPYDPTTTNLAWLKTYILPYLNIAKSCDGTVGTGCFSDYIKAPKGHNLSMSPNLDGNFLKYALTDGTTIAFIFRDTGLNAHIEVLADLNGVKKPNTMGKDIFDFVLTHKPGAWIAVNLKVGGIYPCGTGVNIAVDGYSVNGCGKDVADPNAAGAYCGMKIIQDGYEINSDYPW